jgi:tetratricopeptide (TPR) repeat protein
MTEEGSKRSIEYFESAIERDPDYAIAYVGLADAYNNLVAIGALPPREAMPKAKAAAMKALELDDALAEAHTSLGMVRMQYDWDWAEAKKEFQRAIELNPNSADAHLWYGYYLRLMGRYDEALVEKKRARTLDPLSLFINLQIGRIYYYAGQFDKAIEEHQKTLEMDPNFPMLHLALSQSYLQKGMYEEALAEAQKTVALSGGDPVALALLGSVYGASGRRNEAMKILDELKKRRHVAPFQLATIYESLGEKDQAFKWLERSYEERDAWIIWLRSPLFGSLRSDPRFMKLVKKIGLEE